MRHTNQVIVAAAAALVLACSSPDEPEPSYASQGAPRSGPAPTIEELAGATFTGILDIETKLWPPGDEIWRRGPFDDGRCAPRSGQKEVGDFNGGPTRVVPRARDCGVAVQGGDELNAGFQSDP